jgi:gamma-glutamyl-gamma-aminobutyrate hydrolase PuuD
MDGRPFIGVTTSTRDVDYVAGVIRSATVGRDYVDAVWRAGGLPVVLPTIDPRGADALLGPCRGLLLVGGGDIDPALYGEEPHPASYEVDPQRDAFELALAHAAVERGIPVLGICRGAQLLNVMFGGSLRQDLGEEASRHWRGLDAFHRVVIEPVSRLWTLYEGLQPTVNSLHHQAIGRLGGGLRAAAWSDDLVIEAIEHETVWVLGVQWHPESQSAPVAGGDLLIRTFVRQASMAASLS